MMTAAAVETVGVARAEESPIDLLIKRYWLMRRYWLSTKCGTSSPSMGHDHEDHSDSLAASSALASFAQALRRNRHEDDFDVVMFPADAIDEAIKSLEFCDTSDGDRYVPSQIEEHTQSNSDNSEDATSESDIEDSWIENVLT